MRLFIGLTLCLVSAIAQTAVVNLDGQSATSIQGLEVGSQLYDVAFYYDSYDDLNAVNDFPFLNDFGLYQEGMNSAVDALNTAGAENFLTSNNAQISTVFYLPSASASSSWFAVNPFGTWVVAGLDANGPSSSTNAPFAVFTTSVVPIPAAVWLFGSALLGLGWMRKKA